MSISKQKRKDYEEGRSDRKKGIFEQAIIDIFGNHPGTKEYYKGRSGEQLDKNKKAIKKR